MVAFNSALPPKVEALALKEGVIVQTHDVIYRLVEARAMHSRGSPHAYSRGSSHASSQAVKEILEAAVEPVMEERELGSAEVHPRCGRDAAEVGSQMCAEMRAEATPRSRPRARCARSSRSPSTARTGRTASPSSPTSRARVWCRARYACATAFDCGGVERLCMTVRSRHSSISKRRCALVLAPCAFKKWWSLVLMRS